MVFKDERTPEQKKTPHVIVLATDRFMSGWGGAGGGPSYAGWAVPFSKADEMERRIRNRPEMKYVRIVGPKYRPKAGTGHCHIYNSEMEATS